DGVPVLEVHGRAPLDDEEMRPEGLADLLDDPRPRHAWRGHISRRLRLEIDDDVRELLVRRGHLRNGGGVNVRIEGEARALRVQLGADLDRAPDGTGSDAA